MAMRLDFGKGSSPDKFEHPVRISDFELHILYCYSLSKRNRSASPPSPSLLLLSCSLFAPFLSHTGRSLYTAAPPGGIIFF